VICAPLGGGALLDLSGFRRAARDEDGADLVFGWAELGEAADGALACLGPTCLRSLGSWSAWG
jgi:hypothetical protein